LPSSTRRYGYNMTDSYTQTQAQAYPGFSGLSRVFGLIQGFRAYPGFSGLSRVFGLIQGFRAYPGFSILD